MTFKEKISNYWYYYKYHTIAGIFILIVIIMSVRSCVQNIDGDVTITFAGSANLEYEKFYAKKTVFENVIPDANADGKKNVAFAPIVFTPRMDTPQDISARQKLFALMVSGDSRIYLLQKSFAEEYAKQDVFKSIDEFIPPGRETIKNSNGEVCAVSVEGSKLLEDMGIPTDSLFVAQRIVAPNDEKMTKNVEAFDEAATEVLKLILEDISNTD